MGYDDALFSEVISGIHNQNRRRIRVDNKLTAEQLVDIALLGLKQLKAETNSNMEIFAILTIINTLVAAEGQ